MHRTGLEEFKALLREFRGLSVWATGGSLAIPFVADLVDLSPPWPPGIVALTAVVQLITLILVFQFFKTSSRGLVNRSLAISIVLLAVLSVPYFNLLSIFTYTVPATNERLVKGTECTIDAKIVFKEKCPDLGLDELKTAEYEAERLWTRRSIAFTRTILIFNWLLAFAALSFAVGIFLVYQMRPGRKKEQQPRRIPKDAATGA